MSHHPPTEIQLMIASLFPNLVATHSHLFKQFYDLTPSHNNDMSEVIYVRADLKRMKRLEEQLAAVIKQNKDLTANFNAFAQSNALCRIEVAEMKNQMNEVTNVKKRTCHTQSELTRLVSRQSPPFFAAVQPNLPHEFSRMLSGTNISAQNENDRICKSINFQKPRLNSRSSWHQDASPTNYEQNAQSESCEEDKIQQLQEQLTISEQRNAELSRTVSELKKNLTEQCREIKVQKPRPNRCQQTISQHNQQLHPGVSSRVEQVQVLQKQLKMSQQRKSNLTETVRHAQRELKDIQRIAKCRELDRTSSTEIELQRRCRRKPRCTLKRPKKEICRLADRSRGRYRT